MAKFDITKLKDDEKSKLVEARWTSSSELWDKIRTIYQTNTAIYSNESNWTDNLPYLRQKWIVRANRIFVNMEAVINSIIANPPGINMLPARDTDHAKEFALKLEDFFRQKYIDLNIKETMRKGYRNLYFARLIVIKPFWNPAIDDFDFRALDPRKVRFSKFATKEQDSEFGIEEIDDNLCSVIERFPKKKADLMKKYGFSGENGEAEMYIQNPDVKYKEAWIGDYVIFKCDNMVLDTIRNPYWDWEGILITEEEEQQLASEETALEGDARRQFVQNIKLQQDTRKQQMTEYATSVVSRETPVEQGEDDTTAENPANAPTDPNMPTEEQPNQPAPFKQYFFNYFDKPRKPYIFGTILNNENSPIGRTDFITLSAELQRGIDKRKMDIAENCELVNGIIKVDAGTMGKSDAQRIRWETRGIIWGKNVKDGVTRETGTPLPQMVFDDMQDSRNEIDNIMAASSAFRGEREGQETKAGRLALIQQSYLRLNELIQLGDYIAKEIFDWGMQLTKTRYTEYHKTEMTDKDGDRQVIELIQDDIEPGNKVKIIAGKTLPVDDEFKFEQAQNDFEKGALGLADYLEREGYDNPKELAKNAVAYKINPVVSVGMTDEEMAKLQPPQQEEKPPSVTINYADLPPDAQVQLLGKIGIQADPAIIFAEKTAKNNEKKDEFNLKKQGQEHGQAMSEAALNKPEPAKK